MMITSLNGLKNTLLLTLTLLIVISCGKNDETQSLNPTVFDSQIIIGSTDWKEISELSTTNSIRKASSPVADVTLAAVQSRCTGFLISEDVLMTNEHCIPSASDAVGVTASFRHLKGVSESSWETYDCSTFLMNNVEHDFALLKCSGSPGRKFGFVSIDSNEKSTGLSVYVVQQNCDYYLERGCDWTKKYSTGSFTEVSDEYTHNADTLGGSSGSPVFDSATHKVVGLHHAGYGNNGLGRGYENYAVKMSEIVPVINSQYPDLLSSDVDSPVSSGNNNSLSSAFKLTGKTQVVSGQGISSEDEFDYYTVKAKKNSNVSVKVKFYHSKGDLDVYVVSSNGEVLEKFESSTDDESFSFKSLGEEVYFVVLGYRGAVNTYTLSVDVVDSNVKNDSFESASQLDFFQEEEFSLSENDKDFFFFDLTSTRSVDIKVEFAHAKGDLDVKVFDVNKKLVASSLSTMDIEEVSKYLSKGRYYVQIYGYKGVGNSYKIILSK